MPLFKTISKPNGMILSIWKIQETEFELLGILKNENWILDELATISHPQKRIEYLASRVLVQLLCIEANVTFSGIFKDEHHKPYLVGNCGHISISHTEFYCAAIYHPSKPVGVDIQMISPKLHLVAKKFLNPDELKLLQNDIQKLCLAWCAKEAVYKHVGIKGVSLRNQISILNFDTNFTTIKASFNTIEIVLNVFFIQFDGFSVGYTEESIPAA